WIRISRDGLRALEGAQYTPPFPPAETDPKRAHRLYFASHATLEAGTGLVHTAPGHGAEDYVVGRTEGLQVYAPVNGQGRYTSEVPFWAGESVFDANPKIVARLAETGFLLNRPGETIRHQYPHCWRCKN